jgi:hypothetical protein
MDMSEQPLIRTARCSRILIMLLASLLSACASAARPAVDAEPSTVPIRRTPVTTSFTPTPTSPAAIEASSSIRGEELAAGILAFALDRSRYRLGWESPDRLRILDLVSYTSSLWVLQGTSLRRRGIEPSLERTLKASDWPDNGFVISPDELYVVRCYQGTFGLYRIEARRPAEFLGENFIGRTENDPSDCRSRIAWSPDSSAFLIVSAGAYPNGTGTIRIWPIEARTSTLLAEGNYPAWSPDSGRVAYLRPPAQDQPGTMYLVYRDGGRPWAAPARLKALLPEGISWLSDTVLDVAYMHSHTFYSAAGGELIADWSDDLQIGNRAQPGSISPDGRWLALEHRSIGEADSLPASASYVMYDTASPDHTFQLSAVFDDVLEFLAWSTDSSRIYFVSRPGVEGAVLDPRTPFGLMAYETQGDRLSMLFEQAVDAFFSPDGYWALVIFPSRNGMETPWLAAGLWKVGTQTLIGRERVGDEMIYAHPNDARALTDAAWSPDGRHVAFVNTDHELVVYSTDGTIQRLPACVEAESWSPDGGHLMVHPEQWQPSFSSDPLAAVPWDGFLLIGLPLPQDFDGLACQP